jgi:hypothetical protein
LLTDRRGFQIADFSLPKFTSDKIEYPFMFTLVMVLDIIFFNNRNRSLADETIRFTITFNKEVFASPLFFENPAFVTNDPFLLCHVLVKFTYNSISLTSAVRTIHLFTVYTLPLPTRNDTDLSTNQPTKKLTKGGVLRKRETSSLARFDHSCVRSALLEMVNGALKLYITGGVLTLTGFLSWWKAWTFSNQGFVTGGRLSHHATCPLWKGF